MRGAALIALAAVLAFARYHLGAPSGLNAGLTPGAIGPEDGPTPTRAQVCVPGYASHVRHKFDGQWFAYARAVYSEYGVPDNGQYRVDHLVPLEIGGRPFGRLPNGAWDLRNVWPEPVAESFAKDRVENALRASVCYKRGFRGIHLSLDEAQREIARDWRHTAVGLP